MDEVRKAWVAGLIEGEGWFGIRGNRPMVEVSSTDHDVIERLHVWTGLGKVQGPRLLPSGKSVWRWSVHAREDAGSLMRDILPYLLSRRAATAQAIIQQWQCAPPKRGTEPACKYGHPFSGSNLSLLDPGRRRCRECGMLRERRYRERQKEIVA